MCEYLPLKLEPVANCQIIKGVPFAPEVKFRQILVTGPPGAGKSTMTRQLGGWPQEGYIDLSIKGWWKTRPMAMRPREVHMGLPFVGHDTSLVMFEEDWLNAYEELELDRERIKLPPHKRFALSVDWRERFAFEFILPPPEIIFKQRKKRSRSGTHQVDSEFSLPQIKRQVEVFCKVAEIFNDDDISVHVRSAVDECPSRVVSES